MLEMQTHMQPTWEHAKLLIGVTPGQWQIVLISNHTSTKRPSALLVTAAAQAVAKILLHNQTIRAGSLCMVSSAIWVSQFLRVQPQSDRLHCL